MPTVHVTMPSAMYDELQRIAREMGLSVSGLIKLLVSEGLERLKSERLSRRRRLLEDEQAVEVLTELMARVEKLQQLVEERLTAIEGDLYRVRMQLNNLRRRVSRLEDVVEDKLAPVEVEMSDVYQTA